MKIGDLSRHTGVSVRAIRHCDTLGLLVSKREENGYRTFTQGDTERVRLIQLSLSVGFQLEEIRTYGPCWQTPDSVQEAHTDAILNFQGICQRGQRFCILAVAPGTRGFKRILLFH